MTRQQRMVWNARVNLLERKNKPYYFLLDVHEGQGMVNARRKHVLDIVVSALDTDINIVNWCIDLSYSLGLCTQ